MDEEIDLRPYIEALLSGWYWIVGAGFTAALAMILVTFLQTREYETSAIVAVVEPDIIVQFDQRITENRQNQPVAAFPQLAQSDDVLILLLNEVSIPEISSIDDLRPMLRASSGTDNSIIILSVTHSDRKLTAEIANTWAQIFIAWLNRLYGYTNQDEVQFFEARLAEAAEELSIAEAVLVEYQAENRASLLSNQLDMFLQSHEEYLREQRRVSLLKRDTGALRDRMMEQAVDSPVLVADQLTALILQVQTYTDPDPSAMEPTITLNVNGEEALTTYSREVQVALLDDLLKTLNAESAAIESEIASVGPEILSLQRELRTTEVEYDRLQRNRIVAEETFNALARKVEEERLLALDTSRGVRQISEATIPEHPLSTGLITNVIIAAALATLLSTLFVVGYQWWINFRQLPKHSHSGN